MNFKEYVADKSKVVVIGGGILGLEAAYSALLLEKEVTVIESFDYLLSRQLDKDLSEKLEKTLQQLNQLSGDLTIVQVWSPVQTSIRARLPVSLQKCISRWFFNMVFTMGIRIQAILSCCQTIKLACSISVW